MEKRNSKKWNLKVKKRSYPSEVVRSTEPTITENTVTLTTTVTTIRHHNGR